MNHNEVPFVSTNRVCAFVSSTRGVVLLYATILAALILAVAPYALPVIILDLISALVVLAPPALAGLWIMPILRLDSAPVKWHLAAGMVVGLGLFSLVVLIAGSVGLLYRPLWIGILVILAALGIIRSKQLVLRTLVESNKDVPVSSFDPHRLLWLVTAPFAVAALLAAANPPGVIWSEEGYGYDVLEYHLEMPKEYYLSGHIGYAPHNVYANFPSNVEMLYLVNMIIRGDVFDTGTTANTIHLLLGVLAVGVGWCVGSIHSRRAGLYSGVLLGSVGWIPYLSGLAYVEHGMLAFGMLAIGALFCASVETREQTIEHKAIANCQQKTLSWLLVSGLSAGLACGCKYTAIPMIALPVVLCASFIGRGIRVRIVAMAIVACGSALTLSPWLIKNVVYTSNPVFPLAHSVLHSNSPGWDDSTARRWERGHTLVVDGRANVEEAEGNSESVGWSIGLVVRCRLLWQNILGDSYQRFGLLVLLAPIAGLCLRSSSSQESFARSCLWFALFVQLCVWLFVTHLYGRFAVPLLIPLSLLGGYSLARASSRRHRLGVGALVLIGGGWNLGFVVPLHRTESFPGLAASVLYDGVAPGFRQYKEVNDLPDSRTLLVGEARAFYFRGKVDYHTVFNADPFIAVCEAASGTRVIIDWLREREYTHVLINWHEVERLRRTYGFSGVITREFFGRLVEAGLNLAWESTERLLGGGAIQLFAVQTAR